MVVFEPPTESEITACLDRYKREEKAIRNFGISVVKFFEDDESLFGHNSGETSPIHSIRWRGKSPEHLREKLIRKKVRENRTISAANLLKEVTDLFGVRVLHLYGHQLSSIHSSIMDYVQAGHWVFFETPKAYTWDPEEHERLGKLGLTSTMKPSYYTSVHYVVKPREDTDIACEIQVRTLFEEVWGELDHTINYPEDTTSVACREQLLVLAKVVGAGTRLVDALFRSHEEHRNRELRTRAAASRTTVDKVPEAPNIEVASLPTDRSATEGTGSG